MNVVYACVFILGALMSPVRAQSNESQTMIEDDVHACQVQMLQTSMRLKSIAAHTDSSRTKHISPNAPCQFKDVLSRRAAAGLALVVMCVVGILTYLLSANEKTSLDTCVSGPPAQMTLHHQQESTASSQSHVKTKASNNYNLSALDGLRVLGITGIMVIHLLPYLAIKMHQVVLTLQASGLSFFMILSGFLRVITIKGNPRDSSGFSYGHHVARCFSRFCPAYYLALVLTFVQHDAIGLTDLNMAWPIQASFLSGFLPIYVCPQDTGLPAAKYLPFEALGLGWFVADLFVCLMLFPLLYYSCCRGEGGCGARAVLVICLLSASKYLPSLHHEWGPLNLKAGHFAPLRLLEFLAGMLTGKVAQQLPKSVSHWKAGQAWGWLFDCTLVSIIIISWKIRNHHQAWWGQVATVSVDVSLCFLMVFNYLAVVNEQRHGVLINALGWWPLTSLAKYSFGAYIYTFLPALQLDFMYPIWSNTSCGQWSHVVLPWIMAVGSEKFMEGPIRRCIEARMSESPRTSV
jgi:hypothetical protein